MTTFLDWLRAAPTPQIPPRLPRYAVCCNCLVLSDVDAADRCWGCAWWAHLSAALQGCYDAMVAGNGDLAVLEWQSSWDRLRPVFRGQRKRSGLQAEPHPAIAIADDERAARLCWQFSYGVEPYRLGDINRNGAYQYGRAWRSLIPAMFRSQAAAAARVARRRFEARAAARLPVTVTIARTTLTFKGPLPKVPNMAAQVYRMTAAATARDEERRMDFAVRGEHDPAAWNVVLV